jgi:phosphinothricin acetyltransferase
MEGSSEDSSRSTATIVRDALPEDAAAIATIYNQGIEERLATFETEPRSESDVLAMLAGRDARHPFLVAVEDGAVVAWASARAYSDRSSYAGVGDVYIYVERTRRGSGVGLTVLQALCATCEERGFWKLIGRIFANNVASRALCRKAGFVEVGIQRRHAKLDGEWRDVVIVERLLGEAVL